jgi:hypothetical protein
MFTEEQVLEIIKEKIAADEKLGEQSGGSGHLGYVSYKIKDYKTKQVSSKELEIAYQYCVYVETEFTYYPDNPPLEYHLEKVIVVNRDKKILSEF